MCPKSSAYAEAKVDVTPEIEQRAQQAAQAGADHWRPLFYFLCYIHFSLSVDDYSIKVC